MRRTAFTLIELLMVIAIMGLLIAIIVPSLAGARNAARRATCASQLHTIHTGLAAYWAENQFQMPPFKFSESAKPSLPTSGHYGGDDQQKMFGSAKYVNLSSLVQARAVSGEALYCPGSRVNNKTAEGYFPYTPRYSTYCLRFPPSSDLPGATGKPNLQQALALYATYAGGQKNGPCTIPIVRADRQYSISLGSGVPDGVYQAAQSAIVSDEFWQADFTDTSEPARSGVAASPVRWNWCHGDKFNVLYGTGEVRTAQDDGTVKANSNQAGAAPLANDGLYYATYAERVWQFFDRK